MAQKKYGYQYGGQVYLGGEDQPAENPLRKFFKMGSAQPDVAGSAFGMQTPGGLYPTIRAGYDPEESDLNAMIPESSLYGAQQEIGQAGAESGAGAYYIPSRQELQGSARADLRKYFAGERAKLAQAVLPKQIEAQMKMQGDLAAENLKGQYGLKQEEMKGGAARDVANIVAQRMANQQQTRETGMAGRQQAGIEAQQAAREYQAAQQRIRQLTAKPETTTVPYSLLNYFRGGPTSAYQAAQKEIQDLQAQSNSRGASVAVQQLQRENPGASPEELQQMIQNDYSPEEAQAMISALLRMSGVR